ncbi:MAG: Ribosomal small subunit methyltransferase [Frankiales bacterium]|nr:Ribosomal small subunit methyltransferase [Frankiales bacterium]
MSGLADPAQRADSARLIAHRTLQAVSEDEAYANLVLPRLLNEARLSPRDAALATELAYGTLRASGTLDEVIRACSSRELSDIETGVLNALRLGAYQLLKTRIPAHAAVATTVDLLRATGNARAAGFGNAILRKVSQHDYDEWCARISAGASELGELAVRHAHPGWIVGAFADALAAEGRVDELADALAADDERPVTHLVGWPDRITQSELIEQSGGAAGPYSPYAVRLTEGGEPGGFPAVAERQAGVQDEGSQLCAIALASLPLIGADERWLDLCAGPGGKAALLAALARQRGAALTANELHPHRAELIARATEGWDVAVKVGDARRYQVEELGQFDRILLDAPCTGLGALRRRPEARWRKGPDDLAELSRLQAELIDAAVRLVRPGGVIGYVTCSPHPAETLDQIRDALKRHPDVAALDARTAFATVPELVDAPTVQLWPHRNGTDAMFFAALRKLA